MNKLPGLKLWVCSKIVRASLTVRPRTNAATTPAFRGLTLADLAIASAGILYSSASGLGDGLASDLVEVGALKEVAGDSRLLASLPPCARNFLVGANSPSL